MNVRSQVVIKFSYYSHATHHHVLHLTKKLIGLLNEGLVHITVAVLSVNDSNDSVIYY